MWNALSGESHHSIEEVEYLSLCQARVLVKLGRLKEAKVLINRVRSPVMGATKQTKLEVPENKFNVVGDWRATPEQLPGATPEQP